MDSSGGNERMESVLKLHRFGSGTLGVGVDHSICRGDEDNSFAKDRKSKTWGRLGGSAKKSAVTLNVL